MLEVCWLDWSSLSSKCVKYDSFFLQILYVVDCPQRLPALVPSVTLFSPCITLILSTLILGHLPDLKLTILTINVLILTVLLPYPQKKGKNKHCCVELHPGGIRRH